MNNTFQIDQDVNANVNSIVIRRLPSQMPRSIDRHLSQNSIVHMDGPNQTIRYVFSSHENLIVAVKYLIECGWAQTEELRYCVIDNDNGTVCYCHWEEVAKEIVKALNAHNGIDPEQEFACNGYYRFVWEDMRSYSKERLEMIRMAVPKK